MKETFHDMREYPTSSASSTDTALQICLPSPGSTRQWRQEGDGGGYVGGGGGPAL